MPDMEKVIKGLECAIGIRGVKNCDNCPYDNDFNCLGCDIVMRDALALLKEQEPVEPRSMSDCAWQYSCGECKKPLYAHGFAYCPWCGRRIKWQD